MAAITGTALSSRCLDQIILSHVDEPRPEHHETILRYQHITHALHNGHSLDEIIPLAESFTQTIGSHKRPDWTDLLYADVLIDIGCRAEDALTFKEQIRTATHLRNGRHLISTHLRKGNLAPLERSYCHAAFSTSIIETIERQEPGPRGALLYAIALRHQWHAAGGLLESRQRDLDPNADPSTLRELRRTSRRELGRKLTDFGRYIESLPDSALLKTGMLLQRKRSHIAGQEDLDAITDPTLYNGSHRQRLLSRIYLAAHSEHVRSRPARKDPFGTYHLAKSLLYLGKTQSQWIYSEFIGRALLTDSIEHLESINAPSQGFFRAVNRRLGEAYLRRGISTPNNASDMNEALCALHLALPKDTTTREEVEGPHRKEIRDTHLLLAETYYHLANQQRPPHSRGEQRSVLWYDADKWYANANMWYFLAESHIAQAATHPGRTLDRIILAQDIKIGHVAMRLQELLDSQHMLIELRTRVALYAKDPTPFRRALLMRTLSDTTTTPLEDPAWQPVHDILDHVSEGAEQPRLYNNVINALHEVFPENPVFPMITDINNQVDCIEALHTEAKRLDPHDPRSIIRLIDTARLVDDTSPIKHPISNRITEFETAFTQLTRSGQLLKRPIWMTRRNGGILYDTHYLIEECDEASYLLLQSLHELRERDPTYHPLGIPRIYHWDPDERLLTIELEGRDLATIITHSMDERKMLAHIASESSEHNKQWRRLSTTQQSTPSILTPWIEQIVLLEHALCQTIPQLADKVTIRTMDHPHEYHARAQHSINTIKWQSEKHPDVSNQILAWYSAHVAPALCTMWRALCSDRNATNCVEEIDRQRIRGARASTLGSQRLKREVNIDIESIKRSHYIEDYVSLTMYEGTNFPLRHILALTPTLAQRWNELNPTRPITPRDALRDTIYGGIDKMLHMMEHRQRALDTTIGTRYHTAEERFTIERRTLQFLHQYFARLSSLVRYAKSSKHFSPTEQDAFRHAHDLITSTRLTTTPQYEDPGVRDARDIILRRTLYRGAPHD